MKTFSILFFVSSVVFMQAAHSETLNASSAKITKVLMVVNEGYRPEEYQVPRKLFELAHFEVKVAAHYPGPLRPSRPHWNEVAPVQPDLTFDQANASDYDAVVFIGGNGAWNDLLPNSGVHRLLLESVQQGKVTALICAATGLLATAGNLDGQHPQFNGKRVTGYFEVEGLLKRQGLVQFDSGVQSKPYVVVDGNLITGRDPLSATLFGQTIVAALKK